MLSEIPKVKRLKPVARGSESALTHRWRAESGECPFCSTWHGFEESFTAWRRTGAMDFTLEADCKCRACGRKWTEVYTLACVARPRLHRNGRR